MFDVVTETFLNVSMSRNAGIWRATNDKWCLDLARNEHGEYEDATTYGPFSSEDAAHDHLNNFSNPGDLDSRLWWTIDPSAQSPNGRPSQKVSRSGGRSGFGKGYGRYFMEMS